MVNETNTVGKVRIGHARAIEALDVPIPKGGGLVFLRGGNELGKSSAQDVISDMLSGGKSGGDLARHVDEQGNSHVGHAEGFGVQLRIGQNVTRKGSLFGFVGLDGLDITKAIDPRISDQEAADAERLRVWLDLLGVKPDPELFAQLLGGADELKKVASRETMYAPTLPKIAAGLKRDLERLALTANDELKRLEGEIEAANRDVGDLDLDVEADENVLAARVAVASEELFRLKGRFEQVEKTRKLIADAEARVDALTSEPVRAEAELNAELEQAQQHENQCSEALGKARETVDAVGREVAESLKTIDERIAELQRARADMLVTGQRSVAASIESRTAAENALKLAQAATKSSGERITAARKHHDDVRAARAVVNDVSARIAEEKNLLPTDEQLAAAQAAVDEAGKAKDLGALVRKARANKRRADELQREADVKRTEIDRRREQAAGVWPAATAVVSPILPAGLFVLDGRLKRREAGGRELFFSELSMGARTDIVVRAAAAALDRKAELIAKRTGNPRPVGVLVIDQQFAEALDRQHQEALDALARELNVVIYGAVCDEGELRAVVFAHEPRSFEESTARGLTQAEEQALRDWYAAQGTNGNGTNGHAAESAS